MLGTGIKRQMFTTSTHWYAGAATALIGTKLTGYPATIKQLEPFMVFAVAQGAGGPLHH